MMQGRAGFPCKKSLAVFEWQDKACSTHQMCVPIGTHKKTYGIIDRSENMKPKTVQEMEAYVTKKLWEKEPKLNPSSVDPVPMICAYMIARGYAGLECEEDGKVVCRCTTHELMKCNLFALSCRTYCE